MATLQVVLWQAFRRKLWERDRGVCGICHELVAFEQMQVDHVLAQARGGTHELSNLQVAHKLCNIRKGTGENVRRSPARIPRGVTRRTEPAFESADQMTIMQAAERLRIHPQTVRIWLRTGRLRGNLVGGTKSGYRIPEAEVERKMRGETS